LFDGLAENFDLDPDVGTLEGKAKKKKKGGTLDAQGVANTSPGKNGITHGPSREGWSRIKPTLFACAKIAVKSENRY
jgi:hypothetical protein